MNIFPKASKVKTTQRVPFSAADESIIKLGRPMPSALISQGNLTSLLKLD